MEAVSPLVKFWREAEGKGSIDTDDTDGLDKKVTNDKLSLLFLENKNAQVAVKTPGGLSQRID